VTDEQDRRDQAQEARMDDLCPACRQPYYDCVCRRVTLESVDEMRYAEKDRRP
jgi:hypothetical protein